MQIKTTTILHIQVNGNFFKNLTMPSLDKGIKQLEITYIARGNIKWYSLLGKQFSSRINQNIYLPHNPAILLLDIHPREIKKNAHTKTYKQIFQKFYSEWPNNSNVLK